MVNGVQCGTRCEGRNGHIAHQATVHQPDAKLTDDLTVLRQGDGFFHCPECTVFKHRDPARVRKHYASSHTDSLETNPKHARSPESSPQQERRKRSRLPDSAPPPSSPIPSSPPIPNPSSNFFTIDNSLICPEGLKNDAANLRINVTHNLLMCLDCQVCVERTQLVNHLNRQHKHYKALPESVELVIEDYCIVQKIMPQSDIITPITGLPVLSGCRCTFPGCTYVTENWDSALHGHVFKEHKKEGGAKLLKKTDVQLIRVVPTLYWAVDRTLGSMEDVSEDVTAAHLEAALCVMAEKDSEGVNGAHPPQVPNDLRNVTPFLHTFRWMEIIEGKEMDELHALVDFVKGKPENRPLFKWNKLYWRSIQPMVRDVAGLVRMWIKSKL